MYYHVTRRSAMAVTVVNIIPRSRSGENQQDSEPNLAVNPANPQQMVASAFTFDSSGGPNRAPVYVSNDGGNTWVLSSIVPSPGQTLDITSGLPALVPSSTPALF